MCGVTLCRLCPKLSLDPVVQLRGDVPVTFGRQGTGKFVPNDVACSLDGLDRDRHQPGIHSHSSHCESV